MERKTLGPLGGVGDSMGRSSWFVQVIIFIPSSVKDKIFLVVCDDFQDHPKKILPSFLPLHICTK